MNETGKNLILISILSIIIIFLMFLNTGEIEEIQRLYPPIEQGTTAVQIINNMRIDEFNAGPMDFESAENYCRMKGMSLPTREQAWEMWRASLNCKIAMVLDKEIITDKETFIKSCHNEDEKCVSQASKVTYTCNMDENLLFLDEKTYRLGNYWLKDRFDKNGHYAANFINGTTNVFNDSIKLLGVRCVVQTENINK